MDSWRFNLSTLSTFSAIGLVIAIIAAVLSLMIYRRARNMDAGLQRLFDFRDRWKDKGGHSLWRDIPQLTLEDRHKRRRIASAYLYAQLDEMIGGVIENNWFGRDVFVKTLVPVVKKLLLFNAHKLDTDIKEQQPGWWGGVEYRANLSDIEIDIQGEVGNRRKYWLAEPTPDAG